MKKKIIILIIAAILGGALALPSDALVEPLNKIYCKIKPSECSQEEKE